MFSDAYVKSSTLESGVNRFIYIFDKKMIFKRALSPNMGIGP